MDATYLVTPGETHASIKDTHTFIKINIILSVIILIGWGAWMGYANHKKKWPYDEYTRKTGPPGTQALRDVNMPGTGTSSSSST